MRRRATARGGIMAAGAVLALAVGGCGSSHTSSSSASTAQASTLTPTASGTTTTPAPPTSASTTSSTSAATVSSSTSPTAGRLTVTPRVGTPHSTLRLAFRAPAGPPPGGHTTEIATASVSGPRRAGCVSALAVTVPAPRPGRKATATLTPRGPGGRWCVGAYRARVVELARPVCTPGQLCPQFVRVIAVIGPVSFRIAA